VTQGDDKSDNKFQLLIVGAGAAGLAAALEASTHKVSFVLIEKGNDAPGGILLSKAQRYVSTAMYEWPHPNHVEHEFPLAKPHLLGDDNVPPTLPLSAMEPVTVEKFGQMIGEVVRPHLQNWSKNYTQFLAGQRLASRELFIKKAVIDRATKTSLQNTLKGQTNIHGIPLNEIDLPDVTIECSGLPAGTFKFQYVIYAVGFGNETSNYADNKPAYNGYDHRKFWDEDLIPEPRLGFSKAPTVGILGAGDGALQDTLRCLVIPELVHPLAIWNTILECPQAWRFRLKHSRNVDKAMARIAAADAYTTAGAIWGHDSHIFKSVDEVFKDIVSDLITQEGSKLRRAIRSILRTDVQSVTIVTRHGHFTKAYALNRFLVYLFDGVLRRYKLGHLDITSGDVTSFDPIPGNQRGAVLTIQKSPGSVPQIRECSLAIIRGGLDKAMAPTQLVGLTGIDTGRVELGRIPPPIRPIGMN
jgi:hypothetical protein